EHGRAAPTRAARHRPGRSAKGAAEGRAARRGSRAVAPVPTPSRGPLARVSGAASPAPGRGVPAACAYWLAHTGSSGSGSRGRDVETREGSYEAQTGRPRRRLLDYPRRGRSRFRRWLPSWRLVLGTFLAMGAAGTGLLVAAYISTEIPDADDFAEAQTTTVYFADGTTPMGTFGAQNREIVALESLPEHVGQAFVAAEDRTIFEDSGESFLGTARASMYNHIGVSHVYS